MRLWSTNGHQSGKHLHDVPMGTEEYRMVNAAFKAGFLRIQVFTFAAEAHRGMKLHHCASCMLLAVAQVSARRCPWSSRPQRDCVVARRLVGCRVLANPVLEV